MDKDKKVVFSIAQMADGLPLLVIGVPQGAWDHMKDGKTNTIDLAKVGFPLRVMVYGGKDHDECLNYIKSFNKQVTGNSPLVSNDDFSIENDRPPIILRVKSMEEAQAMSTGESVGEWVYIDSSEKLKGMTFKKGMTYFIHVDVPKIDVDFVYNASKR